MRRSTDPMSHAHRRADDAGPRLHHRWNDPLAEEDHFTEEAPMPQEPELEYTDSCALGAFVGALAGCFIGAMVILGVLMLGGN